MLVRALSFAVLGIDAVPVEVETDITHGLPSYTVVGLPGGAVRESDDRIRAAVRNSGLPFPGRKVTVNLAPADLRKDGSLLDLPIALSVLSAEGVLPGEALAGWVIAGNLSRRHGSSDPRGPLPGDPRAEPSDPGVITPFDNGDEARLVPGIRVVAVRSLREAAAALTGEEPPAMAQTPIPGTARRRTPAPPLPSALPISRTWSVNRWRAGPSRSRRRGASAMLLVGAAGMREDDARRAPARNPPRPLGVGGPRRDAHLRSGRGTAPGPALSSAGRSGASPVDHRGRFAGRRKPAPAGRDLLRSLRCAFSSTNSPNSAPRSGRRSGSRSNREEIRISRSGYRYRFPCRFLLLAATNPVPVRQRGPPPEGLPVLPAAPGPVLEKVFGAPPRPDRPRGLRASGRGRGMVRRGVRRIVRGGPAPGRRLPGGSGGAVRGARFPDERDRPLRDRGTVAGSHAGGGRVPHAGGGTALPVGKGDREGVPRGADDRRPGRRAPRGVPPRRRSPPVPPVGDRNRRVGLEPVGDVPEHFFDVVAEAVDEGAAGVEHRERSAEVEARYARLPRPGRSGGTPSPRRRPCRPRRGSIGAIPRGAHDPVERLPRPGGERRRPVRQGRRPGPPRAGEDPEAEQSLSGRSPTCRGYDPAPPTR